jgi:hypothetical protein
MWVTASLSGTAAGVTNALVALTLASFVASAVFLMVSFSKEERAQNTAAIFDRLREKYDKHLDIIRGLFIWLCAPIIAVYLVFSLLNQFIRRAEIFPCSQPARGEDGQIDIYTFRTRAQINIIKSWNRAKVYTYAIYWGIAYMALEVVIAKLTVVFLSWYESYAILDPNKIISSTRSHTFITVFFKVNHTNIRLRLTLGDSHHLAYWFHHVSIAPDTWCPW